MKPRLPIESAVKPGTQALFAFVAVALAALTGCTGCRVAPTPTPAQRLEAALKRRDQMNQAALPAISPSRLANCPPLNASMVPSTPLANGGHRVTLSWKASAPADPKHAGAVGYCIYRGAVGDSNPGLINLSPLPGTTCVDDLVANGQRYSYVVRAISADGVASLTSNSAPVEIPALGRSNSPLSLPLCRGMGGVN